ncbi:MAG: radical SAM protein [Clostridium sp.]|jgi:uncharacterized protein|nr:radical SAM protein [Clostridium sp.]
MTLKFSRFNILKETEGNACLLFNTKTQALVELDEQGRQSYAGLDPSSVFGSSFTELGFWIEDEDDEIMELIYENRLAMFDQQFIRIVVKLTDDCNFRCPYCYQEHKKRTMGQEQIRAVYQFMRKLHEQRERKFVITYFGGEPLLNLDAILQLEALLDESGIPHTGNISTNGFLLKESVIEKLKGTRIRDVQITLDGPQEIHDRSRVLADGRGTFEEVLQGIQALSKENRFSVILRCNLSPVNEPYIHELLDFLRGQGLIRKHIFVLFNETMDYTGTDSPLFYNSREAYAAAYLEIQKKLLEIGQPLPRHGRTNTFCSMYPSGAYTISPALEIEACTSDEALLGRIDSDGNVHYFRSFYDKMLNPLYAREACMACKVLPMCMGGCMLLHKLGRENCIAQKYIIEDLLPLYQLSNEKYGEDNLP